MQLLHVAEEGILESAWWVFDLKQWKVGLEKEQIVANKVWCAWVGVYW
jgi:hypothetical protein